MSNTASDLLRNKEDEIIAAWEHQVRELIPATRSLDAANLRDGIDILLDHLAKSLEQHESPAESTAVGAALGRDRAALPDYDVYRMLHEYAILRRVVFRALEDGTEVGIPERESILTVLFESFQAAAQAFDETRVGVEKTVRLEREEAVRQLELEREMRERVVAMMSHDLRTPMSVAKTSADIIRRIGEKDEIRQLATKIIDSIGRMELMIRDLLDASMVRAGKKLTVTLSECELQGLLELIAQEQNAIHGERIVVDPAPRVTGWWSESYLKRAIENLCANAIKFGCEETPVRLSQRRAGDRVQVDVHNEGNPITPELQERIFHQFERTVGPKVAGWGLGLTLVRGVAEAHGGSASVQSTPVQGTTFTMDLPVDARPFAGS